MSSNGSSTDTSHTTLSKNLASFYECPVCFEYISPSILQCSNGHMVCSNCSSKLNRCPSCQSPVGTSRNLFMESTLSELHFPCKFSADGCQVTMLLAEKSAHEENCALRPILCECPLKPCKWQGIVDEIVTHFLNKHPAMTITQGDQFPFVIEFDSLLPTECAGWARLHYFHDHHFLFIVRKKRKISDGQDYDRVSATLQLIGTKREAETFSYSLELSGDRHRLNWEGTPLLISDNLQSAGRSHECLVFESTDAFQIFSKNGKLIFDVKIEKYKKYDDDV